MSTHGSGTGSKRFTMSHKAGLTMPASRILKRVRKTRIAKRVQPSSIVFLTAGIEKLLQTLFERSYDSCHDSKKKRLSVKHIRTAMCTDRLLKRHFRHVSLDNTGSVHTYERPRNFEPAKKLAKRQKPVLSARILADADESRAKGGAAVGEDEADDDKTDAATERRGSDSEGEEENDDNDEHDENDDNDDNDELQREGSGAKGKTARKKSKKSMKAPPKKRVSFDAANDGVRPSKGALRNKASVENASKKQKHAV